MSDQISKFLQERIDAGDFPSAVYLVAEKGEIVFQDALGYAVVEPERIEAEVDTIYDVASITKVLVTSLILGKLIDAQEIHIDDSVTSYLKDIGPIRRRAPTILDLATHQSGLAAWKPLYIPESADDLFDWELSPRDLSARILADEISEGSSSVIYSDLGFIILTALIDTFYDLLLNAVFQREISQYLDCPNTHFSPHESQKNRIAASEMGNKFEEKMCTEQGFNVVMDHYPWTYFRDYQIWGEVHDNNAYFMGGVSGHAGLFSTAEETFKIAQQFLPNYTTLLKPKTCKLFRTNFTPGMNEHRSFGFQLASTPDSTAGTKMSPESFGHLGFTGTSLWIDPVKERVFILLTNRTHNHALPFANINAVRRKFHDLAIDLLEKY